jgi:hypothetical protein
MKQDKAARFEKCPTRAAAQKLLLNLAGACKPALAQSDNSFLVLFFKKEQFPFFLGTEYA